MCAAPQSTRRLLLGEPVPCTAGADGLLHCLPATAHSSSGKHFVELLLLPVCIHCGHSCLSVSGFASLCGPQPCRVLWQRMRRALLSGSGSACCAASSRACCALVPVWHWYTLPATSDVQRANFGRPSDLGRFFFGSREAMCARFLPLRHKCSHACLFQLCTGGEAVNTCL